MECIEIDFEVLNTNNPKSLIVGDTSPNWLTAEDKPAYLYITVPNSSKPKVFTFTKKDLNIFNSVNLGISFLSKDCSKSRYISLPDGVYTIELQTAFEDIKLKRYYLKTDTIEYEISKAIVDRILNKSQSNDCFFDTIKEVDKKIIVSKAFIKQGLITESIRYFNEAIDTFKSIK